MSRGCLRYNARRDVTEEAIVRDMLRLVKAGYCKSCGLVPMCDDDCCIMVPERYREGFKLTSDGRKKLREIRNVIEGE